MLEGIENWFGCTHEKDCYTVHPAVARETLSGWVVGFGITLHGSLERASPFRTCRLVRDRTRQSIRHDVPSATRGRTARRRRPVSVRSIYRPRLSRRPVGRDADR